MIDWTRPEREPRMVLYKQSNRPHHDGISYFDLRRTQDANLALRQGGSHAIILHDNMPASALDKMVTFAGAVLFERKPPTSIKPEATPGDRIHFSISGQPEELHALNEKQAQIFLISSLMKQVLKSPNTSTNIHEVIKNYAQKDATNSRLLSCITSRFRNSC